MSSTDSRPFKWSRFGGYEVSSQGDDPRFSAFNAILPDGRTIEMHYQCEVKGYDPGGTNWRLGKGKPPLTCLPQHLWPAYLDLWREWAAQNIELMRELYSQVRRHGDGCTLSDRFATTDVNQAHALSVVLNELSGFTPS